MIKSVLLQVHDKGMKMAPGKDNYVRGHDQNSLAQNNHGKPETLFNQMSRTWCDAELSHIGRWPRLFGIHVWGLVNFSQTFHSTYRRNCRPLDTYWGREADESRARKIPNEITQIWKEWGKEEGGRQKFECDRQRSGKLHRRQNEARICDLAKNP